MRRHVVGEVLAAEETAIVAVKRHSRVSPINIGQRSASSEQSANQSRHNDDDFVRPARTAKNAELVRETPFRRQRLIVRAGQLRIDAGPGAQQHSRIPHPRFRQPFERRRLRT